MSDNRPIGIFDSGLGGISVWRELRIGVPNESLYYFGDGKNCPYGDLSPERIRELVDRAVEVLTTHGIKMLVVACNSATASAIDYLRSKYDFPIVGMEPAVKPASLNSKSGVIGVLATKATLQGGLFQRAVENHAKGVRVIADVGRGFVDVVESGMENSPQAEEIVREVLEPMIAQGADNIVLGCTHYPFLTEAMKRVVGDRDVTIIDPAPAIVRRVETLLENNRMRASKDNDVECRFFSFANQEYEDKMKIIAEKYGKN